MGFTVLPSVNASTDTSGPVRNSSITTRLPDMPKRLWIIMARTASAASCRLWQISTPLPSARPSALTTSGTGARCTYARALSQSSKTS